MRALTVQELTDILFQKPDRITAGVLKERSTVEKLRDEFFTYSNKSNMRSNNPGPFERLRKKILLDFSITAKVSPEHPRSLKQAAFELKALGFSNHQIEEIKRCCYVFTLTECEPHAGLKDILQKDYPNYSYAWCDNAFLGAALVPTDRTKAKTTEEFIAQVEQRQKDENDSTRTKNSIFTPAREEQAYGLFKDYLADYVRAYNNNKMSLFLMPANPRGHYKKLCP